MKKLIYFLAIGTLITSCGLMGMGAKKYNDEIIGEQTKIIRYILDMGKAMGADSLDKAESLRVEGIAQVKKSIEVVNALPDFKGDNSFKEAAIKSFQFYDEALSNYNKELIQILRDKDTGLSEVQTARLQEIVDEMTKKEEVIDANFEKAQKAFAEKNNMKLEDNKIQKEIDKAGE